jgi:hypothetical protein
MHRKEGEKKKASETRQKLIERKGALPIHLLEQHNRERIRVASEKFLRFSFVNRIWDLLLHVTCHLKHLTVE